MNCLRGSNFYWKVWNWIRKSYKKLRILKMPSRAAMVCILWSLQRSSTVENYVPGPSVLHEFIFAWLQRIVSTLVHHSFRLIDINMQCQRSNNSILSSLDYPSPSAFQGVICHIFQYESALTMNTLFSHILLVFPLHPSHSPLPVVSLCWILGPFHTRFICNSFRR